MSRADLYTLGLKPNYTFETLVVGNHNQMASAACLESAKRPGEAYNPLFLFGPAGVGKTHLMQAVANAMLQHSSKLKIKYISAERFASEVISAIGDDNVMAVREHYSQMDLLVMDDIQFLAESKATQGEFFHIFNNMHEKNKQVIMAADRPPNQLTMLDQAIRSRLEWGLAVDVHVPDLNSRIQILKIKQEAQGLSLNDEIVHFAAQSLTSNVRELEGFLKRLHAYVALSHQDLTMELVQQVVREILPVGSAIGGQLESSMMSVPPLAQPPQKKPAPSVVPMGLDTPMPTPPAPPISKSEIEPARQNGHQKPPAPTEDRPTAPPPPAAKPSAVIVPPEPLPEDSMLEDDEAAGAGFKEIPTVFFYPQGKEAELETVHRKFQDVIKKHKLKFRLKRIASHGYESKPKVNYTAFVEVCKQNKVPVAIVIGPPPDVALQEQDFQDLLSVTLDVQGVSLQLVNWVEINKDYRYLNLALDIALVRAR